MLENLQEIRIDGQRVLLTSQLAECYGTTERRIYENYTRNAERYIPRKHYYMMEGADLRAFKDYYANCVSVGLRAPLLYLWTERGTLLHAKSINTDKAWEVYDWLVDFYFRAKPTRRPQEQALYYYGKRPMIPREDFFSITNPSKEIRKLFFRMEIFRPGKDWNVITTDAKREFEQRYNRTFEDPQCLPFLYLSGVEKALSLFGIDERARERLAPYFPKPYR